MLLQINNQSLSTSIWNNCSVITLENTGAAFQIWGTAVAISCEPLMDVTVIWVPSLCFPSVWVLLFCYNALSVRHPPCMKEGTVIDFSCFLYDLSLKQIWKAALLIPQENAPHVNAVLSRWDWTKQFTATLYLLAKAEEKTLTRLFETGKAYFIRFSNMDRLVLPSGLWANRKFRIS